MRKNLSYWELERLISGRLKHHIGHFDDIPKEGDVIFFYASAGDLKLEYEFIIEKVEWFYLKIYHIHVRKPKMRSDMNNVFTL